MRPQKLSIMFVSKETNASYNFKAPAIEKDTDKKVEVVFPTSEFVSPTLSSNAAEVKVERDTTIIDLGTLSAAATLTITPGNDLNIGAKVVVKATSDGTARNVTVKKDADTTVDTISGTASTTKAKQYMWTGTAWITIG